MYFLSDEDRRKLLRRYLPQTREAPISDDLRGWNWSAAPLAPVYSAPLGISEIAGRYCRSGRDVYLRHVLGERGRPSAAMTDGAFYHDVIATVIVRAKQTIYREGTACLGAIEALSEPELPPLPAGASAEASANGRLLWSYEARRIATRSAEALARFPRAGTDALAAAILPITVEQQLDGSFLGVSRTVRVDAAHFSEPMVADLKFGRKERFHRIGLAGYALVSESLLEQPINLGYLVYVDFRDGHVTVEREFHVLSDELRQWFADERDEKARSVELELDPGLSDDCPETCPHWSTCYSA